MGAPLAIALGLVALAGLCIFLAVRYAGKAGASGAESRVVREGRKREAEAERHLHAPRRRGTALLERLRRKRRGNPPEPPAAPER